ncbi:serine/threonine-protein kinase/endoribonuclease IRE1a isoform X1 [Fagus crenata]
MNAYISNWFVLTQIFKLCLSYRPERPDPGWIQTIVDVIYSDSSLIVYEDGQIGFSYPLSWIVRWFSDWKSIYNIKERKKTLKSGKNGSVEKKDKCVLSENGDVFAHTDGDNQMSLRLNKLVDGGTNERRIGKLFVSNTEIAKGSNGIIVLEGIYEGRPVAVKCLVLAHNDRCTCNLDDLIQIYSDCSLNQVFYKDKAMRAMIEYKARLELVKNIFPDLNLWKANGHPSPLLLRLMRDVVSGLVHLHELGIIHQDLKPHNVLIIKERSF